MVLEAMIVHLFNCPRYFMNQFGFLLFTNFFSLLIEPFIHQVIDTHGLGNLFGNNESVDDAPGESVIPVGNKLGDTQTTPGKFFQILVFRTDHRSPKEGPPEGSGPDLLKEMVPVQFKVKNPGLPFVSNFNALDNVLLLFSIYTDDLAQIAAKNALNTV